MKLTRVSDGKQFDGIQGLLEHQERLAAGCKHRNVTVNAGISGKGSKLKAGVSLRCCRCQQIVASMTAKLPPEVLKGKHLTNPDRTASDIHSDWIALDKAYI